MFTLVALFLLADEPDQHRMRQNIQQATLMVAEARAVVELQESRLRTAKIEVRQAQATVDYQTRRAWRLYHLCRAKVVTRRDYEESTHRLQILRLECEREISEIIEIQNNIDLARVRLRIAEQR